MDRLSDLLYLCKDIRYVSNIATIQIHGKLYKLMSVEDILQQYEGVKEFVKGRITVTTGDPI